MTCRELYVHGSAQLAFFPEASHHIHWPVSDTEYVSCKCYQLVAMACLFCTVGAREKALLWKHSVRHLNAVLS